MYYNFKGRKPIYYFFKKQLFTLKFLLPPKSRIKKVNKKRIYR